MSPFVSVSHSRDRRENEAWTSDFNVPAAGKNETSVINMPDCPELRGRLPGMLQTKPASDFLSSEYRRILDLCRA